MDSVSQAVLGASIAGLAAPPGQRRKALLVGAALGTLPDLDVLIDYGDAVGNFTYHRGFSHSLFVLAPFSLALWLLLRWLWEPVRGAPVRWLAAISLALLTHPLLDAHTAYGTQLFWPMTSPPVMWATMFIIDPLYTVPLLFGVSLAAFLPTSVWSGTALRAGVALSTLYIGWSWGAQTIVVNNARDALLDMQMQDAALFVTPTPFNTFLWRVVVQTDDGYLEGFDSLLVKEAAMSFKAYPSDTNALQSASEVWAVNRLRWFSKDFLKAEVVGDRLILSDLRMGQEPSYVFSHVVAIRGNPHWKAVPTELLPTNFSDRALAATWRRLWTDQDLPDTI